VAERRSIRLQIAILLLWLVQTDIFQLPPLHQHFSVVMSCLDLQLILLADGEQRGSTPAFHTLSHWPCLNTFAKRLYKVAIVSRLTLLALVLVSRNQ